jgi:hypothetical protein
VTLSVIIYIITPYFQNPSVAKQTISKIVLLSETNTPTDEFFLINRTSALIVKNENDVYISLEGDVTADEYAVINCVENWWYIERISDVRSVGLKRTEEQYVYKLKAGMCYRLQRNDVIYIENERLLVL